MSQFEIHSRLDNSFCHLARYIKKTGYKKQADKIMRLSRQPKAVVEILKKTFTPALGAFLGQERANNLSMLILYYEPGNSTDLHEYIHDSLMKTNESFYDAERKNKISDQKAWSLANKAVQQLQQKHLLPKELN